MLNTPGIAWEVKARRGFNPKEWAQQAAKNATKSGDIAVVTMRPDGMGEATVGDWPTFLRLDDFLDLLERAGYGEAERRSSVIV